MDGGRHGALTGARWRVKTIWPSLQSAIVGLADPLHPPVSNGIVSYQIGSIALELPAKCVGVQLIVCASHLAGLIYTIYQTRTGDSLD